MPAYSQRHGADGKTVVISRLDAMINSGAKLFHPERKTFQSRAFLQGSRIGCII